MVFLNMNDRSIYTWFCDFVNKVTAFVSIELCLLCLVLCLLYILYKYADCVVHFSDLVKPGD